MINLNSIVRKYTLIAATLFLCNLVFGTTERKTTTLYEDWKNGAWTNSIKQTYTYTNDTVYTVVQENWNSTSNIWINSNLLEHHLKPDGVYSYYIQKIWNSNNNCWDNNLKFLYIYNSDNKVDTIKVQSYISSSWINTSLQIYAFTDNNFTVTIKNLNSSTQLWENSSLTEYLVDGNGNTTGYTAKYWDTTNNVWVGNYMGTLSYNGAIKASAIYQNWVSNAWKYSSRETYTYDTNSYVCFIENWNSGTNTWTSGSQITYQNNSNNNLLTYCYQLWNSTNKNWDNFSRCTNTYETTSIKELKELNLFIFPNPCTNKLSLTLPSDKKASIQIFNTEGKQVLTTTSFIHQSDINVSALNKGVYIIHVNQEGNIGTTRLIKK